MRILDFGCGAGRGLPYFQNYFPQSELWGFDISPESLEVARDRVSTAKLVYDWEIIAEQRFDLIFAANVFHHIPIEERQLALNRCRDVLDEGGQIFLFEHNPAIYLLPFHFSLFTFHSHDTTCHPSLLYCAIVDNPMNLSGLILGKKQRAK